MNVNNAATLFFFVSFFVLYVIACGEENFVPSDVETDITTTITQLSITDAYIMPDPVDALLLNALPQTVKDRNDVEKIVEKIGNLINPKMELYKYLERKREYARTSIFHDIP